LNNESEFEIYTTDTTAAVRWTIFWVTKEASKTDIQVLEWEVWVYETKIEKDETTWKIDLEVIEDEIYEIDLEQPLQTITAWESISIIEATQTKPSIEIIEETQKWQIDDTLKSTLIETIDSKLSVYTNDPRDTETLANNVDEDNSDDTSEAWSDENENITPTCEEDEVYSQHYESCKKKFRFTAFDITTWKKWKQRWDEVMKNYINDEVVECKIWDLDWWSIVDWKCTIDLTPPSLWATVSYNIETTNYNLLVNDTLVELNNTSNLLEIKWKQYASWSKKYVVKHSSFTDEVFYLNSFNSLQIQEK
jgi:hypothetical protein